MKAPLIVKRWPFRLALSLVLCILFAPLVAIWEACRAFWDEITDEDHWGWRRKWRSVFERRLIGLREWENRRVD